MEVVVKFTRCLFAKLNFQRIGTNADAEDVDMGEKLVKAIEFWAEENEVEIGSSEGVDFSVGKGDRSTVDNLDWLHLGGVEEVRRARRGDGETAR